MVIARSCSLTTVADVLAPLVGQPYNTLRERRRDTYREAGTKAGKQRAELDVTECSVLIRDSLEWWLRYFYVHPGCDAHTNKYLARYPSLEPHW